MLITIWKVFGEIYWSQDGYFFSARRRTKSIKMLSISVSKLKLIITLIISALLFNILKNNLKAIKDWQKFKLICKFRLWIKMGWRGWRKRIKRGKLLSNFDDCRPDKCISGQYKILSDFELWVNFHFVTQRFDDTCMISIAICYIDEIYRNRSMNNLSSCSQFTMLSRKLVRVQKFEVKSNFGVKLMFNFLYVTWFFLCW
jgi:hypothetical protein